MNFREQAFNEYNSEEFAVRPGGIKGRGFWNVNSTQFIFAPCFDYIIFPLVSQYTDFAKLFCKKIKPCCCRAFKLLIIPFRNR